MSALFDLATLVNAGIAPTQARAFVEPLNAELARWGINTPKRIAMFVAQASHESRGFVAMEEDLYYRDAARVARLFRSVFDVDRNQVLDPREIEAARAFVRKPEQLANRVYANRNGNGNEASGDGWEFRARGFGITGRDNYFHAGVGTARPYEELPELVSAPFDACKSFCWYWIVNRCNDGADAGDVDAVTRKINPAMAGANERRALYAEAALAFHV